MSYLDTDPEQAAELLSGLREDAERMGMTVHAVIPSSGGSGLLLHGPALSGGVILSAVDEWCDVTALSLSLDGMRALRDALTARLDGAP